MWLCALALYVFGAGATEKVGDEADTLAAVRAQQARLDAVDDELEAAQERLYHVLTQALMEAREERNDAIARIPGFWPQALQNNPQLQDKIGSGDMPILAHLRRVSVTLECAAAASEADGEEWASHNEAEEEFTIEFGFDPNPYFTDSTLWVQVSAHPVRSGIAWASGQRPPQPSVFNFFELVDGPQRAADVAAGAALGHAEVELHEFAHVVHHDLNRNPLGHFDGLFTDDME